MEYQQLQAVPYLVYYTVWNFENYHETIRILPLLILIISLTACGNTTESTFPEDTKNEYLGEIVEDEITLDEIEFLSLDLSKHITLADYKSIISINC